jgi:hypothetical protein
MNREKFVFTFAKPILAAVVTSGIFALGTQTASAQAIIATTPFAFSVDGQFYPAGTYQFTLPSAWRLTIRNTNGGSERFFTVTPEEKRSQGLRGGLLFRNSEGHKILETVYMPGMDITAELLQDKTVSNKAKRHLSSLSTGMSSDKGAATGQSATVR